MTDILLINPPSTTVQNNPISFGLAYIGSYLEEHGFTVKILDLSIDRKTDGEILDYIGLVKPKKVGISCMSVHVSFADRISKKIKSRFCKIQLLLGGIHPTALPEKTVKELKYFDVFVLGEGELTVLELMKDVELSKVNGIAYLKNNKVVINPPRAMIEDLDILPFPARHLFPDMKNYNLGFDWEGKKPAAMVFTSRGCPFNCIYCASKVMWKRKVRFRSAENVLKEVDFLVKKYGVKEILFYDDHFTLNKNRLIAICEGLIKKQKEYKVSWCCLSRTDSLDLEIAKLMKKSGCHMISFGVESGSQTILNAMDKNVLVKDIINTFKICKKAGINTKSSFIFGGPEESYSTVKETQDLIKKILPDYVWFFIMTPMPGTKLYQLHVESGIALEDWSLYNQTTYNRFYKTKFSYNQLRSIVAESYRSYYFSFRYIFSQIRKLNLRKISVLLTLSKNFSVILGYMKKGKGS